MILCRPTRVTSLGLYERLLIFLEQWDGDIDYPSSVRLQGAEKSFCHSQDSKVAAKQWLLKVK